MSTLPAVTMQDLELEHAELLPSRETLCGCHPKCCGGYGSTTVINQYGLVDVGIVNINL
jgi:hypothetical protein